MSDSRLHLVRLRLRADRLARFEQTQRLPTHHDDLGYVTHGLLRALFGERGPSCFVAEERGAREIEVLGYGLADADALKRHSSQFAEPVAHEVVVADSIASKPMPIAWPVGSRLGFTLRACPIKRLAKRAPGGSTDRPEVDAWLHACWKVPNGPAPPRESVYVEWLRAALEGTNIVTMENARVETFRLARLVRRTDRRSGPRKAHTLDRPDVRFTGTIVVRDAAGFEAMLRRGVGRHRDFGFGMMRLLPPTAGR